MAAARFKPTLFFLSARRGLAIIEQEVLTWLIVNVFRDALFSMTA
jgi:hypothetical protein